MSNHLSYAIALRWRWTGTRRAKKNDTIRGLCVKSHADEYCSTFKYRLLEYVIYTSINMH